MIGHEAIPSRSVKSNDPVNALFLDDVDCNFGTIGLREPRFVFQSRRHRAVADFMRIAECIELEQFWSERMAAGMPLAFVLIDANSQPRWHSDSSGRLRFLKLAHSFLLKAIIAAYVLFASA
jgi:hypothetical protein